MRLVPTADIADGLAKRFGADARRHAPAGAGRPGVAIALANDEAARKARRALEGEFYKRVGRGLTDRFAWGGGVAGAEGAPQTRSDAIQSRHVWWSALGR